MNDPEAGPRAIGATGSAMPACPFVGRDDDPALVDALPGSGHRCYKPASPHRIRTDIQGRFCLSARYQRCPVYRGVVAHPPGPSLSERIFGGGLLELITSREGIAFIVFAMLIPAAIGVGFAVLDDDDTAGPSDQAVADPADAAAATDIPTLPAADEEQSQAEAQAQAQAEDPAPVEGETPAASEQAEEPEAEEPPDPDLPPRERLLAWTDLTEHIVQAGDSLGAISSEYGTTIEAIAVYNGIADINTIAIGQVIVVPIGFTDPLEIQQTSSGGQVTDPPAEEDGTGDGSGDGTDEGTDETEEPDSGGIPIATDALIAWTDVVEWTVGPGDTLFLISQDFATTVNAIAALNLIDPASPLQVGQVLRVPQGFLEAVE